MNRISIRSAWVLALVAAACSGMPEIDDAGHPQPVIDSGSNPIDAGDEDAGVQPIVDAGPTEDPDAGPIDSGVIDAGHPVDAGEMDVPPTHALNVTATRAKHTHSFLPKTADPAVRATTFSGTGMEIGAVDPRAAKMMGKLVISLGGSGSTGGSLGGPGDFAVARGFHVFAVAYDADYNILINDPDYYGDARREEFDGVDHTSRYATRDNKPDEKLGLDAADGVLRRVTMGLRYLKMTAPDEDWGYYLDAQNNVRWSDVIFAGVSHGASSAARFAMIVRAGGAIALSGPRDNTCNTLACTSAPNVIATWFNEVPKTPIDRFYAITGSTDAQHLQHTVAFERLHFLGAVTEIQGAHAPYGNSHRLTSMGSGHGAFCGTASFNEVCNYVFRVPVENQAGVP